MIPHLLSAKPLGSKCGKLQLGHHFRGTFIFSFLLKIGPCSTFLSCTVGTLLHVSVCLHALCIVQPIPKSHPQHSRKAQECPWQFTVCLLGAQLSPSSTKGTAAFISPASWSNIPLVCPILFFVTGMPCQKGCIGGYDTHILKDSPRLPKMKAVQGWELWVTTSSVKVSSCSKTHLHSSFLHF